MAKKKSKIIEPNNTLTLLQIVNTLNIQGCYKIFLAKKYRNSKMTLEDWRDCLNKDGLKF